MPGNKRECKNEISKSPCGLKKPRRSLMRQSSMKMKHLMLRIPHLPGQIFQKLDPESLFKCREVTTSWQNIIDGRNYPWLRIMNIPTILKKGNSYLHLAARTGQIEVCKEAIIKEEDKNIKK